ncbi:MULTISPECIES: EAL domain-containing protein [Enterobacter]|uniref:EAL domain-containing protein n=1 Tax=Enterobacter dykesii TaxID=2797506 RepID=A0AAU7J6S9_9ENTR|nr:MULTISPECIES: EAL domain-containing protein [Enterobacter]KAA0527147.1 EAL domain-containing protein [Enterobacter asburiae]KAA0535316.1 EAL domain-containing protein [Enterobacter dykesii]MCV3771047.1 EAL domain-containing protein [Enterobacter sp. RD4-1-1]RTN83421.1 EAL domain-containing protein [Enterobacter asburiae]RTP81823.1 EAL domain-containing protein [Enterobacter asburiae]
MTHNISLRNRVCDEQKFVISACGFTFQGYRLFLNQYGIQASHIHFDGDEASQQDMENILINQNAHVVVFLGKGILSLLESLKRLASVLNALPVIRRVTLYGDIPDGWLYRTLGSLLNNSYQLSLIRLARVSDVVTGSHTHHHVFKERSYLLRDRYRDNSSQDNVKWLTKREIDVLLNFYRGMSVKEMCDEMGLSNKTVYTHRKEGVLKLRLIKRWLHDSHNFNAERSIKRRSQNTEFTDKEAEIFNALYKKEIFPAYQIITDRDKKGVGFEILIRWNKNGKIVKPASFLTDISNHEIWLKITALVIHAAVSGINKYNGKYYFSVNIPPRLASGNALPDMAKKAIDMLLKPQWAEKLVFEFAEDIDVTKDKGIPETMRHLRNTGCRLFLDDCFSNHQTMFPVRQVHFDGLKLDRDIVEHFVANDNDYNLIKAIQIYSDMTGTDCIAEGVDSEEKFEKLVALGVKNFQGYYLSRAVKEDELDRMVRIFS